MAKVKNILQAILKPWQDYLLKKKKKMKLCNANRMEYDVNWLVIILEVTVS